MRNLYRTNSAVYEVDPVEKTVTRHRVQGHPVWLDGLKVPYEFIQRDSDGSLFFYSSDPRTGQRKPFSTEKVIERI